MSSTASTLAGFLLFSIVGILSPLFAQDGERVFPKQQIHNAEMPMHLRMESADGIGDTVFVVWSTVKLRDGWDMIGALYGQYVVGGEPQGDPFIIHSADARPRNYVGVTGARGAFIVLWNDYRDPDSSHVYMQTVRSPAAPSAEDQSIGKLLIGPSGIQRYGNPEQGRIVRWGEATNIFLEFDTIGVLRREPLIVESRLHQQYYGTGGEGSSVVAFKNGEAVFINEDAARISDDSVTDNRFLNPHYLAPDGKLSLIRQDSIYIYGQPDETTPESGIPIPMDSSAVPGTTFLYRHPEGDFTLIFSSLYDAITLSDRWSGTKFGIFSLAVCRMKISSTGLVLSNDTLVRQRYPQGHTNFDSRFFDDYSLAKSEITQVCPGGVVLKHTLQWHFFSSTTQVENKEDSWSVCIEIGLPEARAFKCDTFPAPKTFPCDSVRPLYAFPLTLTRIASDYRSEVELIAGDDSLSLSLRTDIEYMPDTLDVQIARTAPALVLRDSELLLLTIVKGKFNLYALDEFTRKHAFRGEQTLDGWKMNQQTASSIPYVRTDYVQGGYKGKNGFVRGTNAALYQGFMERSDVYYRIHELELRIWYDTIFSYRSYIGIPSSEGWIVPATYQLFPLIVNDLNHRDNSISMDNLILLREPNLGVTMYHLRSPRFGFRNIYQGDDGEFLRPLTQPGPKHPSVPIVLLDSLTYLGIHQNRLYEVNDTGAVEIDTNLTDLNADDSHMRLLGDYFLAMRYISDSEVLIRLYTTDRRLLHSEVHPLAEKSLPSLHQNLVDSSIVLLQKTGEGITATFYRKDLHLLVRDSLLIRSGTLQDYSAVFKKDTLVVVWQDGRDGYPDLFQQRMWLPAPPAADSSMLTVKGIEREEREVLSAVRVLPNPASCTATLMFDLSVPLLLPVRIYDDLGRMAREYPVREYPSGTGTLPLDLQDLSTGSYTVVVGAGTNRQIVRLIIIP